MKEVGSVANFWLISPGMGGGFVNEGRGFRGRKAEISYL